jgi:hypothetical protein
MAVPTEAKITNYYDPGTVGNRLNPITLTAANTVQLTRLCPVPHAWAAKFLDSKDTLRGMADGLPVDCHLGYSQRKGPSAILCQLVEGRVRKMWSCGGGPLL